MAYPRIYAKRHSAGLLISVVFLLCYTGGNGLVVKTSVGDDVVLPCEAGNNTDATDLPLHWSRTDSNEYVHFRRDGRDVMKGQTPTYKGRTSLFKDELKKGNVSLKLSSVTHSDEGIYTCYIPEINKKCTVQVFVGAAEPGVTYSEVNYQNKAKANNKKESPAPQDAVYSLVKPGTSLGGR